MTIGTYDDFFRALGQNESGNNYSFVSSLGYLGRFQFGEEALKAVGFYQGDSTWAIDFAGGWTATAAAHGAWDKWSFLNSPDAQDTAARAWFSNINDDLNMLGLRKYEGQWVGGVHVTDSGLIAGAHLVGVWNLKSFLETGGAVNVRDGYGTPVSEYLQKFGDYQTPFASGTPSYTPPAPYTPPPTPTPGVDAAHATTSVAALSYQFFTGHIPSRGGMDYLVSPTGGNPANLNSAYYQSFSLENRYINFAVNLGKTGEGRAGFDAAYGSLTLFDAAHKAYETIFGAAPSDAKIHALLDATVDLNGMVMSRSDYFDAYGQDGPIGLGTKAAMVGWLLAEAVKADVGMYAHANDAFLTDLADGADFGVDLVGVYGRPDYVYHPG